MNNITQEKWRSRLLDWQASGQPLQTYARKMGINPKSFHGWKARFLGTKFRKPIYNFQDYSSKIINQPKTELAIPPPLQFVELSSQEVSTSNKYQLELSCGWRLGIPSDFDDKSLRRLLGLMEGM